MSINREPRLDVWHLVNAIVFPQEDILKVQEVVTFSETLGVNPRFWEFQLRHYAEEPDVIAAPVFRPDQCLAQFSFHYKHLNQNLAISGIIYIDVRNHSVQNSRSSI
jgi:hypothetical protein